MAKEIQAKGLQHIRNLKNFAVKLNKDLGGCPGLFGECVDAALLAHRLKCLKEQKRLIEENIESGNPS